MNTESRVVYAHGCIMAVDAGGKILALQDDSNDSSPAADQHAPVSIAELNQSLQHVAQGLRALCPSVQTAIQGLQDFETAMAKQKVASTV